jgi:catechol 2,3-dioxygenase-like lactoylglutathione lyase family enzyme
MTTVAARSVHPALLRLRTEHVGFTVRDLTRSIAYYAACLGPPFFRGAEGHPYDGVKGGYFRDHDVITIELQEPLR